MKVPGRLVAGALFALLLCAPLVFDRYWVDVLNSIGLYAILGLSLNIILGYAGMFHMGHAAFYAIGAYATPILNTSYGVPVLWTLPVSGLAAALFALLVARPIIHLRGDYLLIVTIAGACAVVACMNDAAILALQLAEPYDINRIFSFIEQGT